MAFSFEKSEWYLRSGDAAWSLNALAAARPRPVYVYDLDELRQRARRFRPSGDRVHFAMKSNGLSRALECLRGEGFGVDVVSLGEAQKALELGFAPKDVIFSGVGKDREDLTFAIRHDILQVNVESFEELRALGDLARGMKRTVDVALRINILLEAPTHKHIQTATEESKFGLDVRLLPEVLSWLDTRPELRLRGLAVHIGSQIVDVGVFEKMAVQTGAIYREVKQRGFPLARLDLGGGLGIDYQTRGEEDFERLAGYQKAIAKHGTDAEIVLEPGRFLVARTGVLLAKVVYVKKGASKQFLILNAGMNALMRPALYEAYHRIEALKPRDGTRETYSVVGPICESTDEFASARELAPLLPGDQVGIFEAGAYGAVMANTYNESPLPEQWSLLDGRWEVT